MSIEETPEKLTSRVVRKFITARPDPSILDSPTVVAELRRRFEEGAEEDAREHERARQKSLIRSRFKWFD